jgi:hypothetical protein
MKRISRQAKWDLQEADLAAALLEWYSSHTAHSLNDPRDVDVDYPPKQATSAEEDYITMTEVCGYHCMYSLNLLATSH